MIPPQALNPMNVRLGAWLKAKRESSGLSLVQVAETVHLEASILGDIEDGKRGAPMKLLEELRRLYHFRPTELIEAILQAQNENHNKPKN